MAIAPRPLKSDLLGLDWLVVIGHKWNDYRNVIPEVYPKLFRAHFARDVHRLVQFALSYKRWFTAHCLFVSYAACGPQIAIAIPTDYRIIPRNSTPVNRPNSIGQRTGKII